MTDKKTDAAPKKNNIGRPTLYSKELVENICIELSLGKSLASICKQEGMPAQSQIYVWLQKYPEFQERYTRAREEQAETHADEIVDIADETPALVEIKDDKGNVIDYKLDSAFIAWQRQRIDSRKWNAAKQRPKKYGDKVMTEHTGLDGGPIALAAVDLKNLTDEELENMTKLLAKVGRS